MFSVCNKYYFHVPGSPNYWPKIFSQSASIPFKLWLEKGEHVPVVCLVLKRPFSGPRTGPEMMSNVRTFIPTVSLSVR